MITMQNNVPNLFFSMEEPPVRIFLYPEKTLPMKRSTGNLFVVFSEADLWKYVTDTIRLNITLNINGPKQNEETVGSTRRLLQYCHLPDKYSCHISVDIKNFSRYFNIFTYFFHNFLRNPQLCSAEPWLGSTAVDFLKERPM